MNDITHKHEHENCKHLLGSLSEYVDGELNKELCQLLEQHMEDCNNCQVVVDTLRKTVSLYHTATEPETLPGEIRQRLFKSLNIEAYLE